MALHTLIFLSLLGRTFAAPQITGTAWTSVPTICGVLSSSPPCPYGYTCHPYEGYPTDYCSDLDDDEICGFCSKPSLTPTPTLTSKPSSSVSALCPEGFSQDYRHMCRPITTTTKASSSTFTCSSGYTLDYRGYTYCRRTIHITSTSSSTSTPKITCSSGSATDYRGNCFPTPSTTPAPSSSTSSVRLYCSSGWATDYRGLCIPPVTSPRNTCASGWATDYRGFCRPTPTPAPAFSASVIGVE